jgi:hypothetical protein
MVEWTIDSFLHREVVMSDINFKFKHGRSIEDASAKLHFAVDELQQRLGGVIQKAEWSENNTHVHLTAENFNADVWVDPTEVHATGDVPVLSGVLGKLSGLLGGSGGIGEQLKELMHRTFEHKEG